MSRYRKTMRQAIEEGLSNMQVAILKKEYAPFKGKTISAARAKQLMNILDKFKEADLKKLSTAGIPFVSSGAGSKLAVRNMKFKVTTINPFKEEVTAVYTDKQTRQVKSKKFKDIKTANDYFRKSKEAAGQITYKEEQEITQEDFDLEEGKMKTIATMFSQGKSAEEIAKKMGLSVDTVKTILGEVNEGADTRELTNLYNKRTPLTPAEQKRKAELEKKLGVNEELEEKIQPFMISYSKYGKHAGFEDAKSLQDLQTKAQKLRAKGFTIDKMGRYNPPVRKEDKDAFDPITEACWTGYKQVGMKDKGGKKVPNCVPEEFKVEDYIVEEINEEDKKKMKKVDIAPDGDAEHAETTDEKKSDDKEKLKAEIEKKDDEIQKLKVKAETEKAKVAKKETEKMVNPETGEPLLQVGVAYKHLRDKMKKEKIKEDADYLKPRLNPQQIANIKKVFMKKKASDITPSVKAMIKKMDIPTQLAIKQADIPHISKLIEGKYTRYSDLLIQLGRMKQAKDKQGEMNTQKEIDKEKRKLGIKEDLNQDDEKVIKKVKDMLKGASAKHAAQAKMIDKALKNEADLTKSQTKKVHDKADDLPKKSFRDRYGKEKGDSVRYGVATKMVKKKLNIENKEHPAKDLYEQIKGLKNKAEKSGMPYGILKKVYDRGMAAWRGGHRPGTTQQQWAFARVNSFVTKSSGTWGGADKDLAKQVRGSK